MKKDHQKAQHQQGENTTKKNVSVISERKNSFILPVIIAFCLPVLLYIQTVNFKFTYFDDDGIIVDNIKFLSNSQNARQAFLTDAFIANSSPLYRPLQTISYMADIQLSGGNNAWMFHLSNILLLGAVSCLLYLLLRKFLIPAMLALLSTLIYCAHPLFVSSVAWIPARGDLMLLFFSLLSFLLLIEYLQKKKIIYLFFHWIAFTIALFCKETAAFLPFLFIMYYFSFSTEKRFEKKYLLNIILYAVSGIFWYWLRSLAIKDYSNPNDISRLAAIQSNLPTIPESLAKFFLPFKTTPIPGFTLINTLIGLIIIIALIILFFRNKERSKKELIFCFSWFILLIIPPLPFKHPLVDYLDHRFFLPLIGILLFVLFILPKKWFVKGDIKRSWIMIVVLLILCSSTFINSRSYSDPLNFYNSAISKNQHSAIAYCNRGFMRSNAGDEKSALADYDKAISINDNYAELYYNRGVSNKKLNNFKNAFEDFDKAILIRPDYAEAYNNRGNVRSDMGNNIEAIYDYKKALSLRPNYARAYNNMGVSMGLLNKSSEALTNFNKAIEINPQYIEAYLNRIIAKYNLKDFTGAIEDCNTVLKIEPGNEKAINIKSLIQQEIQTK
jgi:tetratricopeptide (TPR) repeat protein